MTYVSNISGLSRIYCENLIFFRTVPLRTTLWSEWAIFYFVNQLPSEYSLVNKPITYICNQVAQKNVQAHHDTEKEC